MTNYTPTEGDTVRVILEGEVESVGRTTFIVGGNGLPRTPRGHVKSIEKIEQPYEPRAGDVIVLRGMPEPDHPLTFSRGGEWRCTCVSATKEPAEFIDGALRQGRYTLLVRGGKVVTS